MPDDRESPSTCWEEVYAAMGAATDHDPGEDEERRRSPCPECGEPSDRVVGDTYVCEEHGTWQTTDQTTDD